MICLLVVIIIIILGIIHYFANIDYAREGGKSSCMLYNMFVLASIPVHETNVANQHFYNTLLGSFRGGGM